MLLLLRSWLFQDSLLVLFLRVLWIVGVVEIACVGVIDLPEAQAQLLSKVPPIPRAGPLSRPKSLDQVGVPRDSRRAAAPANNPQTREKVALGEKLFFDGRLSVDGTVACSTCHDPALAFTDGRSVSVGVRGRTGQRNSPTILNALYNNAQFWDGRAKTLEDQAVLPIINPSEMGQPSLEAAVAQIAALSSGEIVVAGHHPRIPTHPCEPYCQFSQWLWCTPTTDHDLAT